LTIDKRDTRPVIHRGVTDTIFILLYGSQRFGVEADVVDADEISRRFPLIATEPYPMINDEGDEVSMNETIHLETPKYTQTLFHVCFPSSMMMVMQSCEPHIQANLNIITSGAVSLHTQRRVQKSSPSRYSIEALMPQSLKPKPVSVGRAATSRTVCCLRAWMRVPGPDRLLERSVVSLQVELVHTDQD
jgi:hypothetical protein